MTVLLWTENVTCASKKGEICVPLSIIKTSNRKNIKQIWLFFFKIHNFLQWIYTLIAKSKKMKPCKFKVLYMWSSFWLLEVESRNFSYNEKKRIAFKKVQIHKITTIFTQNDNLEQFWAKVFVILWICSALQVVLSFSAWEK